MNSPAAAFSYMRSGNTNESSAPSSPGAKPGWALALGLPQVLHSVLGRARRQHGGGCWPARPAQPRRAVEPRSTAAGERSTPRCGRCKSRLNFRLDCVSHWSVGKMRARIPALHSSDISSKPGCCRRRRLVVRAADVSLLCPCYFRVRLQEFPCSDAVGNWTLHLA
jgi:hypothetical protein